MFKQLFNWLKGNFIFIILVIIVGFFAWYTYQKMETKLQDVYRNNNNLRRQLEHGLISRVPPDELTNIKYNERDPNDTSDLSDETIPEPDQELKENTLNTIAQYDLDNQNQESKESQNGAEGVQSLNQQIGEKGIDDADSEIEFDDFDSFIGGQSFSYESYIGSDIQGLLETPTKTTTRNDNWEQEQTISKGESDIYVEDDKRVANTIGIGEVEETVDNGVKYVENTTSIREVEETVDNGVKDVENTTSIREVEETVDNGDIEETTGNREVETSDIEVAETTDNRELENTDKVEETTNVEPATTESNDKSKFKLKLKKPTSLINFTNGRGQLPKKMDESRKLRLSGLK